MAKPAIATWSFNSLSLSDAYEAIRGAGIAGVDVRTAEPHIQRPNRLDSLKQVEELAKESKDQLDAYGLTPLGLAMRTDASPFDADSTVYNEEFDKNLAFAAGVGALYLNEHALNSLMAAEMGHKAALDKLVAVWRECARRAEEVGVKLVWEFEGGSAFRTPEEIIAIGEALADENFGLLYDTSHAHVIAETGFEPPRDKYFKPLPGGQLEFIERVKGLIGHIHIGDTDAKPAYWGEEAHQYTTSHVPFGDGDIDWDAIGPALFNAAPDHEWWCLDAYGWTGDASQVSEWVSKYEQWLTKSEAEAKKS